MQLVLDVAIVDVERRHSGPPGAEHRLDVLGSVMGVDAQQVLPHFVTGKVGALRLTSQSPGIQVRREPVGPLDDLRIGVAAVALDDEFSITDHGRDGIGGGRDGELWYRVGHRAGLAVAEVSVNVAYSVL